LEKAYRIALHWDRKYSRSRIELHLFVAGCGKIFAPDRLMPIQLLLLLKQFPWATSPLKSQ
jgi:hypothetical protein